MKKCIYFNGYGETWTYDAGKDEWTNMKPAKSPPPRRHAAMCFDEARGVTILHGGVDHESRKVSGILAFSIHPSHNPIYRADTWSYDAERNEWTELKPAGVAAEGLDGARSGRLRSRPQVRWSCSTSAPASGRCDSRARKSPPSRRRCPRSLLETTPAARQTGRRSRGQGLAGDAAQRAGQHLGGTQDSRCRPRGA